MDSNLGKWSIGRENSIDFLRFFLAALVIFSHSYPLLLKTSNREEPIYVATGGQKTGGELAVEGFFILSGFLITRSWFSSRGLGDYLLRRSLRIYPGFFAAALFSGLIAAPLLSPDVNEYRRLFSPWSFALGAIDLCLTIPGQGVNGSLWSIRYEFLCYLAIAALGLLGVLGRRRLVLAAFLVCLTYYAGQVHLGWRVPGSRLSWLYCYPEFWPRVMSAFLAGAVAYLYRDRIAFSTGLVATAVAALALGTLVPSWRLLPVLFPMAGAYLLLFLAFQPEHAQVNFARRGDFSYGLYLYSFPIQMLLVKWFGPWLVPTGLFLAALAVSMGAAFLSWHFVERPFLRRTRSSRVVGASEADGHPHRASGPINALG